MAVIKLPALTIPLNTAASNIIGGFLFDNGGKISIMAPATISGVVKVEVSDVEPGSAVDADFRTLQSGGADVTVTADDATVITTVAFRSLRLLEDNTSHAAEVFAVVMQEQNVEIY